MVRWQYCMIANPGSGTDSVAFSNPQGENLAAIWSQRVGRGLKAEHSNAQFLHLNLGHTSTVIVAGWLGQDEWELVSHAVLTGGHEYWSFKKLI